MNKSLVLLLPLVLAGCATAQKGALIGAYKALEEGNCATVYRKLSSAEKYTEVDDDLQAEISFIRASCLEKENNYQEAFDLYKYIAKRFPNSEYAIRSTARIKSLKEKIQKLIIDLRNLENT